MRMIYHNLIDDITASAISVLTEDSNYPKDNLLDQRLVIPYRTTSPTAQTAIFDLGSAQAVTIAGILGHNISSAASITVEANSSDSWPGATSKTVVHNAGIMLNFFSSLSYRYWKFTIDDPTNPDGYDEVGLFWLGTYLSISPSSLTDFKVKKKRSDTVTYGKHRQKLASIGVGWRRFELGFPPSAYAMIKQVEDMFDHVGNHTSFIFCNFDTIRDYQLVEPCYVSIDGDIGFGHSRSMQFSYALNLEEDK